MARTGTVYMLASQKGGTIYIGVTADMPGRMYQHQTGNGSIFAKQYGALRLVWYEEHDLVTRAITREKTIKRWRRQWKVEAIERMNPDWSDLKSHLILW